MFVSTYVVGSKPLLALELAEGVEIVPAWLCVAGCVLRLEKAGDFFPQKNAKNDDFDASYWP